MYQPYTSLIITYLYKASGLTGLYKASGLTGLFTSQFNFAFPDVI